MHQRPTTAIPRILFGPRAHRKFGLQAISSGHVLGIPVDDRYRDGRHGVAAAALWFLWRRRPMGHRLWWWAAVTVAFLPLLANSFGWIFTEMGRQPWLVFGLMTTRTGVSPGTTTAEVLMSMSLFTVLYGVLAVIEMRLLMRYARAGPEPYDGRSLDPKDRAEDEPFVFTY